MFERPLFWFGRPPAVMVAGALGVSIAVAAPMLSIMQAPVEAKGPTESLGASSVGATEVMPGRVSGSPGGPGGRPAPAGPATSDASLATSHGASGLDESVLDDAVDDAAAITEAIDDAAAIAEATDDAAAFDQAIDAAEANDEPVLEAGVAPEPRPQLVRGTIGRGRTLAAALGDHGIGAASVHAIVAALKPHYDFRKAPAAAAWEIEVDPDGDVARFLFEPGPLASYEARRDESGALSGRRLDTPVEVVPVRIEATIDRSLYEAIAATGESPALAARIADVFAWDLDFSRDQQPGDSFRMLVEKRYAQDELVGYGRVLAAEYRGRRGDYSAFWYELDEDRGHYYLADGRSAEKTFLATPLRYSRVSSRFDRNRRHPILGYTRAHNGTDFAAPRGTPVWAMASGRVVFAGRKGGSGKLVVIEHDNGLKSYYAHLHRIDRGIRSGVRVRQKEQIGTVGSTGLATGPHLHLGVKKNGRWVDPQRLKITRNAPLPSEHRERFQQVVAARLALLEDGLPTSPAATRVASIDAEPSAVID